MKALLPSDETNRLAALKAYHILDTGTEQSYDDITTLAAHICEVPIVMISLVDDVRQWFKSSVGVEVKETAREVAFCSHAILQSGPFIVKDTLKDPRFVDNALVTGKPNIRFYAGIPLVNPQGLALGTLCVVDRKPRQLSTVQQKALEALSRQVMALLELRRVSSLLGDALNQAKTLRALLPICAWWKRIRDDEGYWNQVEVYIHKYTGTDFSHGICPQCMEKANVNLRLEQAARREAKLNPQILPGQHSACEQLAVVPVEINAKAERGGEINCHEDPALPKCQPAGRTQYQRGQQKLTHNTTAKQS